MLDWQLLHQGCPAYDLAYFLTGSFREVQIEEFGDRLLKAYLLRPIFLLVLSPFRPTDFLFVVHRYLLYGFRSGIQQA